MVKEDIVKSPNPGFSPDLDGGSQAGSAPVSQPSAPEQPGEGVEEKKMESVSANNDVVDNAKGMELSAPQTDAGAIVGSPGAGVSGAGSASDPYAVTQQMRDEATKGYDVGRKFYYDWLSKHPEETEEERKKREKKERAKKIISAVGDGISAISNLYFTTQYAPNAYDPKDSGLKAVNDRIEKLRLDREKDAERRRVYVEAAANAEAGRAKTLRELEAQMEARKIAKEKADREARDEAARRSLDPFKQGKAKAEQDYWQYKSDEQKEAAANAPEMQKAKLKTEQARGEAQRASAVNSYASAKAHDRSNQQVVHHFNGKTYPKGSNDYEKDVREAARKYNERHGKWTTDDNGKRVWKYDDGFDPIIIDRTESNGYGQKIKPRKAEEYAGEVESRLAEELGNDEFNKDNYKRGGSGKSTTTGGGTSSAPPLN